MAYRPGSQIRSFFKSGGFTLTDRSPKYAPGKIPLFKSLKNLSARERLYAVGYNLSTLGGFGFDFGRIVSMPYMVGEYANTARAVVKNLKTPTNVLQGQFIKRQKLLAGAKSVGKAKSSLSRTLRTGTPIDRATNIVLGRESAGLLGSIREFGSAGAILNVVQETNAAKVDAEILRQASIPSKENVFRKWQTLTFTEAFKLAPNPFYDNPVRKAEKIRHRTVQTKGQEFNIESINLGKNLNTGMDIKRASQFMSIMDAQNFSGTTGLQDDLVSLMLDQEGEAYFSNKKGLAKYKSLSQERRIRMYEQAHYNNIGKVMRSGSQNVRDFEDRQISAEGIQATNTTLEDEIGLDGKRKRVQDIIYEPEPGRSSSYRSRKVKEELNSSFINAFNDDIGAGPDDALQNLASFELGPDVMQGFKKVAMAFNFPLPKDLNSMNVLPMIQMITSMSTTVSNLEIKQGFFVGNGMRIKALEDFIKTLRKNGYTSFAKSLRSKAGFRRKDNDPMSYVLAEGGFLGGRNQLINSLQRDLNSGVLYSLTSGMAPGEVPMDYRFQPSGSLIENKKLSNEILNKRTKTKRGLQKIVIPHTDQYTMGDRAHHAFMENGHTMDSIAELKKRKIKRRGVHTFKTEGFKTVEHHINIEEMVTNKTNFITYENLLGGHVPGMKVHIAPNGKFRGLTIDKNLIHDGLFHGKPQEWYVKKIKKMHNEFAREVGKLNIFPGMNLYDIQQSGEKIRKSSSAESITRKIEKMRKEQFEIAQLQQALQSDVVGGHVKHKDKHSFRGTSVAKRNHHNYVPTKGQIRKSIHMHDLEKYGRSEDGTNFLFRYAVTAGGSSKASKIADEIRDIASIEFGGFAHDKNMSLEKRTDGMFYTGSHFMGIAGTKAAAYLGIWDKGAEFKTKVDGGNFVAKISSAGGVSPFDVVGTDAQGFKTQVRKDVASLKKGMTEGNKRLKQLSQDLTDALGGGGNVRNNSEYSSRQARIASNRALALYRKSGQFGNVSGGDIFTAMDDIDRANLGLVGDKVGSNFRFNSSSMGTYSAGQRRHIGTFGSTENIHGMEYSYKSGDDHFGKMYSYRFKDLATGVLHYGEMPVVPMLNTELIRLKNVFTTYASKGQKGTAFDPEFVGRRNITTNWQAFSEFTGISPGQLKKILGAAESAGIADLQMPDFRFDTTLNPSNNPLVKKIFNNPTEELVSQFGLNKINGPLAALDGKQISTNSPSHPANIFKEVFLTGEMAKQVQYNTYMMYKFELRRILATCDDSTKAILERTIREYAREDGQGFMRSLNKILQNNLSASVVTSEYEFRRMLMRLQFTIKYSKLNAAKHARDLKRKYGSVKPIAAEVSETFVSTDGRIDPEIFNNARFQMRPDEDGYELFIPEEDGVVVKKDLLNLTQKEIEMIEFYDPLYQMMDDFAVDPRFGTRGPKVVRDLNLDPSEFNQNNIYSQAQANAIVQELARQADGEIDEKLVEYYSDLFENEAQYGRTQYEDDVPQLKGKFRAGVDVGSPGVEAVHPNAYKSTTPSMDNIVREFSLRETRTRKVKRVMLDAAKYLKSNNQIANEYWKATRNTIRTMNEQTILEDLVYLTGLRSTAGAGITNGTANAADFVKQFWYASIPTHKKSGGRYVNFLETMKAGDAETVKITPEYTKLVNAIRMLGYTFPKSRIHKSDTHGAIALLDDDDFHAIAVLLLRNANSANRFIGQAPARALRYAHNNNLTIKNFLEFGDDS